MKEACVKAVEDAIERPLKAAEERGIEQRIRRWQNILAKRDTPGWRSMSGSQRLNAAAEAAAQEIVADLAKNKQRINLMVATMDRAEREIADAGPVTAADPTARQRAVSRMLVWDVAERGGQALESAAAAMEKMALGAMRKVLLATKPRVLGLFENKQGLHDLIREIYGEDTGNSVAKEAAADWKKYADEARDRFNAAGGDIGKLGEHYFPNFTDPYRAGMAKADRWVADTLGLLDRDKYLRNDGTRMSDKELTEFLGHAFDNILNDGHTSIADAKPQPDMLNKDVFGKQGYGYGLYADRNAHHRQLFFKDADSFMRYQDLYGGHSFYSMLEGHVRRMARDTAVLERFGPFADQAFKYLNERERTAALRAASDQKAKIEKEASFNRAVYDRVTGRSLHEDTKVGRFFLALRNSLTALRLGKVVLTAFGDEAGMFATALANRIPYSEVLLNQAKLLSTERRGDRIDLESAGLGLQTMLGSLNRFGGELYGDGLSGRFANSTMRISGAERMWDTRRQAIGAALMHHIGQWSRDVERVSDLTEATHGMIARKGISQSAWDTIRQASLDSDGRVTPKQIADIPDADLKERGNPQALRREAATALMSHVLEEAGMGVMDTGLRQRVRISQATGGLTDNEIGKSMLLFKTFATSMMMKHWQRMASLQGVGNKVGYGTALALYGAVIAAARNQIGNILGGQNPEDFSTWQPWGHAILRGGGLGYFGDFLYDAQNSNDNTFMEALGGPVEGLGSDIWNVTGAAAFKAGKGERVDEAAKVIRLARNNMPFTQLWYTSAVFDHLLWNNIQEAANPGYLDRMQERQAKYGRSYWWNPHDTVPDQGPSLEPLRGRQP